MGETALFQPSLDEFVKVQDTALKELQSAELADGTRIDLTAKVTNIKLSFIDVDTRVLAVCGLAQRIVGAGDEPLIPRNFIDSVSGALDTIQGRYQTIVDQLANQKGQGGAGTFNQETGVITSRNGQANFKFGGLIQGLWNDCDIALTAIYPLMFAVRPKGQPNLTPLLNSFKTLVNQAQEQHDEI